MFPLYKSFFPRPSVGGLKALTFRGGVDLRLRRRWWVARRPLKPGVTWSEEGRPILGWQDTEVRYKM